MFWLKVELVCYNVTRFSIKKKLLISSIFIAQCVFKFKIRFQMSLHCVSQVSEDRHGAGGGSSSPRGAGSSDELWAQMQVSVST